MWLSIAPHSVGVEGWRPGSNVPEGSRTAVSRSLHHRRSKLLCTYSTATSGVDGATNPTYPSGARPPDPPSSRACLVFSRLQVVPNTTPSAEDGPVLLRSRRIDPDHIPRLSQVCADVQGRLCLLDCPPWVIWPRGEMVERQLDRRECESHHREFILPV
jgi:hypothetical protein